MIDASAICEAARGLGAMALDCRDAKGRLAMTAVEGARQRTDESFLVLFFKKERSCFLIGSGSPRPIRSR
jgi:hypothetical protein